jgi:hypothetical protein
MATIVKLPAVRVRNLRETEGEGSATILFFTGVRYVRDADPDLELAMAETVLADPSIETQDAGAVAYN